MISSFDRKFEELRDEYITEEEVMDYVKEICLENQIFKNEIDIWT